MNIRLRYAGDIEALWYLRTDLLQHPGTPCRASTSAKNVIDAGDTQLFQGLLPRALRPVQAAPGTRVLSRITRAWRSRRCGGVMRVKASPCQGLQMPPINQRVSLFHRQ